jgi:hypothetical protein
LSSIRIYLLTTASIRCVGVPAGIDPRWEAGWGLAALHAGTNPCA